MEATSTAKRTSLAPTWPASTRVAAMPWWRVAAELDDRGFAVLNGLLDGSECAYLARCYDDAARFRSRIVMSRHGFGRGEYQYFAYPLPPLVQELRAQIYARLSPIANAWQQRLGRSERFPDNH